MWDAAGSIAVGGLLGVIAMFLVQVSAEGMVGSRLVWGKRGLKNLLSLSYIQAANWFWLCAVEVLLVHYFSGITPQPGALFQFLLCSI